MNFLFDGGNPGNAGVLRYFILVFERAVFSKMTVLENLKIFEVITENLKKIQEKLLTLHKNSVIVKKLERAIWFAVFDLNSAILLSLFLWVSKRIVEDGRQNIRRIYMLSDSKYMEERGSVLLYFFRDST